jgi:hypothetical protein
MPTTTEPFDLGATVSMVYQALVAVISNIGFQAASAGMIVACIIGLLGYVALMRKQRQSKPLLNVFRKVSIFCVVLATPGALCLLTSGHLPQVNQLQLHPLGLIGFWSLVIAHLCLEEFNFQWFPEN